MSESYRRSHDGPGREVEDSMAGATSAGDHGKRTYIDPEQADRGRRAASSDWAAGTVRTNQDVCRWEHSSYGLAYVERIDELKATHSWRPGVKSAQL